MNKKLDIVFAITLGFCVLETRAEFPIGATVPDFTLKDIKGVSHNLYSYFNKGQAVAIDAFATWCGPCMGYHESGAFENFYKLFGPEGDNTGMAFGIEGDAKTNGACLSGKTGCVGGTLGDWLTGTFYPVVDLTADEEKPFSEKFRTAGFPTIHLVCPNKKVIYNERVGTTAAALMQELVAAKGKCATTSVIDGGIDSRISVHPNISSGSVFVGVGAEGPLAVKMGVYDAAGKAVLAKAAGVPGSREFKFDLSAQPDGLYYVRVKTANGLITRKILLSK